MLSRAGHEQNRVAPAAFHGVGSSKKLDALCCDSQKFLLSFVLFGSCCFHFGLIQFRIEVPDFTCAPNDEVHSGVSESTSEEILQASVERDYKENY